MSATDAADLEAGGNSLGSGATGGGSGGGGGCRGARSLRSRSGRRRRRPSMAFFSGDANTDGGSSLGFSDSDEQSSAHFDSSFAADEYGSSGIFSYPHSHRQSLSDEADLESGELEVKVHSGKDEKRCRICHLKFAAASNGGGDQTEEEEDGGGVALELGCNCKGDLGAAHQQCAETWFKIRGNMICEICGATAQNVTVEQTNEASNATETEATETIEASASAPVLVVPTEPQSFWQGRRIMNFLLACMVFAFIISWLFHFNILP